MTEDIKCSQITQWKIGVPIFKNQLILRQLALAVGIPFGLLVFFIGLTWDGTGGSKYALFVIALLMGMTWLFIQGVYGGKYEAEFRIDDKGILCRTQSDQRKKNGIINGLTIILGFLSKKPGLAGVGFLAQDRQEVFLRWKQVQKVSYHPESRTILIRGGWLESFALFCTEENYEKVQKIIQLKVGGCVEK